MFQGQRDVVQSVQQTVLSKCIDIKGRLETAGICDCLRDKVDRYSWTRLRLCHANQFSDRIFVKHDREKPVFKAVIIESDEQLTHVSRYLHLNPYVACLTKEVDQYKWTSYREYIDQGFPGLCSKEEVLSHFKGPQDYQQFVLDQASYALEIEFIKHQLIEEV